LSLALTAIVLPLIPLFLLTRHHFRQKLTVFSNLVQSDRLRFADFLQEHLASIVAIQLLGRERRQERKAFLLLGQMAHSQQKLFTTGVWFTVSTSLVVALAMCTVIGYGGWSVFAGTLTVGTLVAFYGFVTQLFDPLSSVAETYSRAHKTFASIRQVQQIFAIAPAIANCPSPIYLRDDHSWQVDIVGLKFRYEGQRAKLHIPSLRILPGEQIALAGENGAGKSTLAKLMTRIYDVDSGSIRLGGDDIRDLELTTLRQWVCYLPREPVLFGGTLASNLRFVRPGASQPELEEVLERVGLSAFLSMLNRDLNHEIGPAGCQLSGGQRQRLTIARALLQRPRVLILDEATSCLDPVSEELVLRNLRHHLPVSTLIVISHRLSTISSFPRILVLSDGQIVADGNPQMLLSECDTFSKLFL
jgi:ABC-type multidrug transport system fused ATPase/permease subunit